MAEFPRVRIIEGYAVFDESGRLCTARPRERDALEAASIIGGSSWKDTGYTVEPVQIIRSNVPTR